MLVLLLALGCGEPQVTGPNVMVGRIVDDAGAPMGGIRVETLETSAITGTDGTFVIRYKDPDRHVNWATDRVHWRRHYLPSDDGQVVTIALPPMEPRRLDCAIDCKYTLEWTYGEGLTAQVLGRCKVGEDPSLGMVPVSVPAARCRDTDAPATLVEDGAAWRLLPPAASLRIELGSTDEARLGSGCEVLVGDRPADPDGEGAWIGEVYEPAVVTAICDGLPARPARVDRDTGRVRLAWSAHGPRVDLEHLAPWASALELTALDQAWTLRLAPTAQGVFRLPPLDAGRYAVRVEGPQGSADAPPAPEAREGVLVLAGEGEQLVGLLHTEADLIDGVLTVEGPVTR